MENTNTDKRADEQQTEARLSPLIENAKRFAGYVDDAYWEFRTRVDKTDQQAVALGKVRIQVAVLRAEQANNLLAEAQARMMGNGGL